MCFFRALSVASATAPTRSPNVRTLRAAEVIASRSTLLRSIFLTDFGSEALRSLLDDRRDSLRLFKAMPPARPARAAPPATKGVFAFDAMFETFLRVLRTEADWGFAFDASSATFSPVLPTGPFEEVLAALAFEVRAVDALAEPFLLLPFLLLDVLDGLFLLFELLALELRRLRRLPEDRVV